MALGYNEKRIEEGIRNLLVVDHGGLACLVRLAAFLSLSGDGRADLGEGSGDVDRRVVEGSAGVADGEAHELDAFPISLGDAKEEMVFLSLLGKLLVASEVMHKFISKMMREQSL